MEYFVIYSENDRVQINSFKTIEEATNKKRELFQKGFRATIIHGESRLY